LVPGIVVTLAVSILASGALGRWLRVRRSIAWALLFSLGVILSATLSPLDGAEGVTQDAVRTCDFSRTWPASMSDVLQGNDVALNIVMFLPLGCAIGIAPLSRRKMLVLVGAIALPFAIEAVQLFVVPLDRACQTADIVDNLTGLTIGLVAGAVIAWLAPVIRRPLAPES
jgi:hypothetical protein